MKQTSIHIKPCCQAELNEGQKNSKETLQQREVGSLSGMHFKIEAIYIL